MLFPFDQYFCFAEVNFVLEANRPPGVAPIGRIYVGHRAYGFTRSRGATRCRLTECLPSAQVTVWRKGYGSRGKRGTELKAKIA